MVTNELKKVSFYIFGMKIQSFEKVIFLSGVQKKMVENGRDY